MGSNLDVRLHLDFWISTHRRRYFEYIIVQFVVYKTKFHFYFFVNNFKRITADYSISRLVMTHVSTKNQYW